MHSVSSDAVAKMFEQMCFPIGFQFFENFDVSYQSGDSWHDVDVWWRVFEGTYTDPNSSQIYAEITVINKFYFHAPPNVTKYVVSPQWRNSPDTAVIQICKSNTSCHGIRVGRDSNNHWFIDLQLFANYYTIFAQGDNFKRSTKLSKVTMSGFSYVSSIVN